VFKQSSDELTMLKKT